MKRLCVYCGSSPGSGNSYINAAKEFAQLLVASGIDLVYGGSHRGIMGVLADAVLEGGGKVSGVIPQSLCDKEVVHEGLTELHIVSSMHERKSLMAMLSDGFVAMPGGYGTLEEIVEVLTWGQLQFHEKPCGFLNVGGYFDPSIIETWPNLESYETVTPIEIADKIANDEITLVDVRATSEWDEGHIPGAQHVMLGYLPKRAREIPNDKPVVVHCRTSNRSAIGASVLQAEGVTNVLKMEGGYVAWAAAGLPIEHNGKA